MTGPRLARLKRILAETLLRADLDTTDDIMILTALLSDFRWKDRMASARRLAGEWKALLAAPPAGHFLNLYLHFPYCREKCLFCLYASRVPPIARHIQDFLAQVQSELDFFIRVLDATPARTFMAGGGTPSMLSEEDLKRLFGPVFKGVRFEENARLSVECSPASIDDGKLRALRRLGFSRVSFGVQSLDAKVLDSVRRGYQRPEMVAAAVRGARAAGFEDVNLDVIFGLVGDSTATFLDSFRAVARLRPTTITICGLTLTDGYMRAKKLTREGYYSGYAALLPPALEGLRRLAKEEGYGIDELTPERGIWNLVAEGTPPHLLAEMGRSRDYGPHPYSIMGLGDNSRSHIFGRALYMRGTAAFDPNAPLYRLAPLSRKEEMAMYLLCAVENGGRMRNADFLQRFGASLEGAFALELRALELLGAVRPEPGGFLFLPQEPASRIFHGLIFLLDTVRASPFSAGLIDASFLQALREELDEALVPR